MNRRSMIFGRILVLAMLFFVLAGAVSATEASVGKKNGSYDFDTYGRLEQERTTVPMVVRRKDSKEADRDQFEIRTSSPLKLASPDQEYSLTNTGDCELTLSLIVFKDDTVSGLIDRYPDHKGFFETVLKNKSEVYFGDAAQEELRYLTVDSTFKAGFKSDADEEIRRILPGETVTFFLPEAEEGKLYRIVIEPNDKLIQIYNILIANVKTVSVAVQPFADVPDSAYYAEAVAWAVKNKITTGTTETTFSPADTCTTAQILTLLWRTYGQVKSAIANPFTDVSETSYYYQAALWAYENGLVEGDVFNGSEPCRRANVVTYLWKLAGRPEAAPADFADVDSGAEYAQAVAWAVSEEITNGTSATEFSPDAICTRAQIVTLLHRALAK